MAQFTIAHLYDEQIEDAYPMVRMAAPDLSLERWVEFGLSAIAGEGGVLGAYSGDGTLHGVAVYCPDDRLLAGRVLRIEPMVTFELNPRSPARAALCEALELLAAAKGCRQLVFHLPSRGHADPQSDKGEGWRRLGMALETVTFVKPLKWPAPQGAAAARRGANGG